MTAFALEALYKIKDNYPKNLLDFWGSEIQNPIDFFLLVQKKAKEIGADYLSFYFNIDDVEEIKNCVFTIKKIAELSSMPLIVRGCGNKAIDALLIPELIPYLPKNTILGCVQDTNYKNIVKYAKDLKLILRTPIDINLTKELNILSIDEGLKAQNILIDPDMGCVGYGLDYGFSIIERIKIAANTGDDMLNMPIIVFAGEESFKAKEAKSTDFKPSWGELETRSLTYETVTSSALITAGADVVVLWHPTSLEKLKKEWCHA